MNLVDKHPTKRLLSVPRFHKTPAGWELRDSSRVHCDAPITLRSKQKPKAKPRSTDKIADAESTDVIQAFVSLFANKLKLVGAESEKRRLLRESTQGAISILNEIVGMTTRIFGED